MLKLDLAPPGDILLKQTQSNAWKNYVPEDLSLEEKFAKLMSSTPVPPAGPQKDPWIRGGWSAMMEP